MFIACYTLVIRVKVNENVKVCNIEDLKYCGRKTWLVIPMTIIDCTVSCNQESRWGLKANGLLVFWIEAQGRTLLHSALDHSGHKQFKISTCLAYHLCSKIKIYFYRFKSFHSPYIQNHLPGQVVFSRAVTVRIHTS